MCDINKGQWSVRIVNSKNNTNNTKIPKSFFFQLFHFLFFSVIKVVKMPVHFFRMKLVFLVSKLFYIYTHHSWNLEISGFCVSGIREKLVCYVTQRSNSKFTTQNLFQIKTGNLQWRSIQCNHWPTTISKLEFISRQFRFCSIVRNDSVPRSKYGQQSNNRHSTGSYSFNHYYHY